MNAPKNEDANTNSIIISGGEKGGVGKSFFTKCLLSYFESKQWQEQFLLIEADPTISDVSQVFRDNYEKVVFSDNKFDFDEPNIIIDKLIKKTTIVNLPSNVSRQFEDWSNRIGIFSPELKKYYKEINYFFVTDGCYHSIQQFLLHLDKYKDSGMNNCLVLNSGRLTCGGNFTYLQKYEPFIHKIQQYNIPIIALPELSSTYQFNCDMGNLSYNEYLNKPNIGITEKSAMANFLRQLNDLFEKIFPHQVASAEGLPKIIDEQAKDRKAGKVTIGAKDSKTRLMRLL